MLLINFGIVENQNKPVSNNIPRELDKEFNGQKGLIC